MNRPPAPATTTWASALHELQQPCGRFRFHPPPTASYEYAARAFLERFGLGSAHPHSSIPENWRFLLVYLKNRGIIRSPRFGIYDPSRYIPELHTYALRLDRSVRGTDGTIPSYDGGFAGSFSREDAMSKAVGETLERAALSTYRESALAEASPSTFAEGLLPDYFLAWQKKRFPELARNPEASLRAVTCESMDDGSPMPLPAQLVFWNYNHGGERVISRPTTSGCAGHFTLEEATLAALFELIQRDGFLIFWLNRIAPPVLDITQLQDAELQRVIKEARSRGAELTFLDTTSDIAVPSVTCIARAAEGPAFAVGAGTGFNVSQNILSAAIEALQVLQYSASGPAFELPERYEPFTDASIGRSERLHLWKGARMEKEISFFLSGPLVDMPVSANAADTVRQQLARVLELLRQSGYPAYRYQAQDPVLAELGYHAVRVIVPDLVPLYLSEHAAPLGAARLRMVPARLGYEAAKTFNPFPHPFP